MSSKRARALIGIQETPDASNREIGQRVGVSANTVMRARSAPRPTIPRGKQMSEQALIDLARNEPAVLDMVTKAMQTAIDFLSTRGKLLRSLTNEHRGE